MENHRCDPDAEYIDIVNEINDFIASLEKGSTISVIENRPEPVEHEYEPIGIPRTITAVATADLVTPNDPSAMGDPGGYVPKQVKAVHPFKGSNNDELCLLKGEIITLTQTPEGGWWEGTLNGKTGWFPSNYVKEVKDVPGGSKAGPNMTAGTVITPDMPVLKRESMQYYHNVVLQNVIETERTHVSQMANFLQTYLRPLMSSGVLSPVEYSTLTGNLEDIAAFQQKFLSSIEECSNCSAHQRRVGGVFMKHAPHMKELYMAYCANHPRAVAQLQAKRVDLNKCMETIGAQPPGSMTLTTNLSKPFTRLDRYPSLLKELERHIEESHVDRGDTQRAIAVYRDIANSCMEIRKMKEMEFEIIESTIMGWEGEEMSLLGEVLHLSQVKVYIAGEKHDRIFVLFPSILVMLSMSPRLSGYQYEGKLPLSGMSVCMCDEAENIPNGFEISGNMIEKIVVSSTTETDQKTWIDLIGQQVLESQTSETSKHQSLQISTSQPSISTLTQAKTAEVVHSPCNYQAKTAEVGHSPCNYQPKTARVVHSTCNYQMNKTWSMSCLRPSPPLRPPLMYKEDSRPGRRPGRRKPDRTLSEDEYDYAWRRYDPQTMQEDGFILRVIDAYCTSAKTRHTVNSSVINCPSLIIPEEEKIIVDDGGDPAMIQEKSLVDTVYSLKDQVKALEQDHKRMRIDFEEEKKSRMRLESFIRKVLKNQVDLSWEEALA